MYKRMTVYDMKERGNRMNAAQLEIMSILQNGGLSDMDMIALLEFMAFAMKCNAFNNEAFTTQIRYDKDEDTEQMEE